MKFVSSLTQEQEENLKKIMDTHPSRRVRMRAHSILLSNRGHTIKSISDIYEVDRDTVSSWIDSWEKYGYDGLPDKPRSGRPPKLTEDEKKTAEDLIRANRRSVKKAAAELKEKTGKTVSLRTLKRIAKSAGMTWRRIRRSLKSKRNQEEFEKAQEEITELRRQHQNEEIDVFYFDESGFTLEPSVPYAWSSPDGTDGIPSSKSRRLNVLGFLSTDNRFQSFMFECSADSDVVVACFNYFSEIITKKTVVIIDNAPTHTSQEFEDHIEEWEEKGLFIKKLPTYSPELNLIEILWRFIKYHWLPFSAYLSFDNLVSEVEKILKGVGSEYRINFSEV